MKKKLIVLLILTISLISNFNPIYADNVDILKNLDNIEINQMTKVEQDLLKKEISKMSDDVFDQYMINLLQNSDDLNKLTKNLLYLGVDVFIPKTQYDILEVPPYSATISVSSAKRTGDPYYRLYGYTSLSYPETKSGSYDVITVYFDSSKANYYSYNTSSYTDLRSGLYATSGTVVFNLYDKYMGISTQYGAVYVTPKSGYSGQWVDFGADWTHTFTKPEVTGITPTAQISFGGKGIVSGSIGVSVSIDPSVEQKWDKADTNAFRIP